MDTFDLINIYVIGTAQMSVIFLCFSKFYDVRIKPFTFFIFIVIFLSEISFSADNAALQIIIFMMTLLLAGRFLFKAHWAQSGLFDVITGCVSTFCYGVGNCILAFANSAVSNWNSEAIVIFIIIINFIELSAIMIICSFIKKYLLYTEIYNSYYTLFTLIPITLIYFIEQYINYIIFGNVVSTEADLIIFTFIPYQTFLIEFASIGALFCVMLVYKKLLENFELNSRFNTLKLESKYLKQYAAQIKSMYEKTRAFRHDAENHLTVIGALIDEQKYGEASSYINEIKENTSEFSFPINTGNPIINVLLKNKLGYADDLGIKTDCKLTLPYPCEVSDTDLCIILSNAADNAIAASKILPSDKEKHIEITSFIQGDLIVLEIKNTYLGTESIKEDVGIKNIRAAAQKYNGHVEISSDGYQFTLKILLVIPQRKNGIL